MILPLFVLIVPEANTNALLVPEEFPFAVMLTQSKLAPELVFVIEEFRVTLELAVNVNKVFADQVMLDEAFQVIFPASPHPAQFVAFVLIVTFPRPKFV